MMAAVGESLLVPSHAGDDDSDGSDYEDSESISSVSDEIDLLCESISSTYDTSESSPEDDDDLYSNLEVYHDVTVELNPETASKERVFACAEQSNAEANITLRS
uniref:Uncharacterized protein n=1 Tax=Parascaris equorum TaxID=6256 RepID=A0A914RXS5_PAREQ